MAKTHIDDTRSKEIGKYVGPVLAVLFLSEIITLPIYTVPAGEQIVYLNGFVLFLFGFYLVRIHTVWTTRWPILITLSAWAMTGLGLYRLFFPTAVQATVKAMTYLMLVVFFVIQLCITYKSYVK